MVERLTDDYAAQIREKWTEERIGCHCQPYRKPCTYHEGMLDGTDLAAQFLLSQLREQREVIEEAMKDHVRFHSYVGNEDGVLIPVPCTICDAALAALSPVADERTEP